MDSPEQESTVQELRQRVGELMTDNHALKKANLAQQQENVLLRDQLSSRLVRGVQGLDHFLRNRGVEPKRIARALYALEPQTIQKALELSGPRVLAKVSRPRRLLRRHKPKVLYVLVDYPQLSETYIKTEINVLRSQYDIKVAALYPANIEDPDHLPYQKVSSTEEIIALVREFQPSIVHAHYMLTVKMLAEIAKATGVPFTIRGHSYDILRAGPTIPAHQTGLQEVLRDNDLFLGILAFPFQIPILTWAFRKRRSSASRR